jgi:hypothetical protein
MPRRKCDVVDCPELSVDVVSWDKSGNDQSHVCARHYDIWAKHWKKIEEE